ncbi:sec-independent protein translocase protein TatA [Flavobacterium glaciei]|uniref:Sec-independent protein translocase protein TatA n=6 Tax=Flavobacterium TaxID=237 RepID=A0A562PY32_9FLAO|nr:sec-independent protein translocase protein TatA [Flavobacterium glaciei]TWI49070.1 sec-independent protein translocase protein TatA [Flavobacterium glaciei]
MYQNELPLTNSIYLCFKIYYKFASAINYSIMGRLGVTEILVILAIVLLLFGGKKIPELMKGLGSGIKEFKNAAKDGQPADKKEEETK